VKKPVILLFTEYSCCAQSPFLVGGALLLPRSLLCICRRSGLDNIFGIVLIKSCYVLAVVLYRSRFQVFRLTRRRRLLKTFRGCSTPFPSLCFFLCSSLPFFFPSFISNSSQAMAGWEHLSSASGSRWSLAAKWHLVHFLIEKSASDESSFSALRVQEIVVTKWPIVQN